MYTTSNTKATKKLYKFIRTPKPLWEELNKEFNFTVDACSSDKNHLCDKYFTKDNSGLDADWTGETVYCHPMYDVNIGKWYKKASESKALTVILAPANTNAKYFQTYVYDRDKCRDNVTIRFLPKSQPGNTNRGWLMNTDSDNENEAKMGFLRPLMIVIFNNLLC